MAEAPYGWIKRVLGFRPFSLRASGRRRVHGIWCARRPTSAGSVRSAPPERGQSGRRQRRVRAMGPIGAENTATTAPIRAWSADQRQNASDLPAAKPADRACRVLRHRLLGLRREACPVVLGAGYKESERGVQACRAEETHWSRTYAARSAQHSPQTPWNVSVVPSSY